MNKLLAPRHALFALLALVVAVHTASACGGGGNVSTGTGASGAGGGGPGGGLVGFGGGLGTGGAGNGLGCSGDLRNVIDGSGNVVMTCPPAEGCESGACVPACQAAGASRGNLGCDFLVPTPIADTSQLCLGIFVANNWTSNATITVTYGAQTLDVTTFAHVPDGSLPPAQWPALGPAGLPPNQVAALYLSAEGGGAVFECPSAPAVAGRTSVATVPNVYPYETTGFGTAFHVTADVPVSAYDIYPFGGASSDTPSATLLMPTTAWGTSYLAIVPPQGTAPNNARWMQIIASSDQTTVQIVPKAALPSGPNVAAAPANALAKFTLNAGQYLQWMRTDGEITGSIVNADKPIAFIGGIEELLLLSQTSTSSASDEDHEQMPPVSALGATYVGAPFATRRASLAAESIPYRIVGFVDGTALSYDPAVPGAPATLSLGQVVDFESETPFVVSSQGKDHPFYLSQVMSGGFFTDGERPTNDPSLGSDCVGDPETVNVLPPLQFLPKYIFFTDPTYATSTLTLVRQQTKGAFQDVTVGCLGVVSGWQPIDAAGQYQYADVDLKRATKSVGTCKDGPQVAESAAPFGLTVWGLDRCTSYGYPAGGNAATINDVVITPTTK